MASKEFKFSGVSRVGQPVQGTVFAPSRKIAEQKVDALADRHGFRKRELLQRQVYLYKVRHTNGKTILGEQKAFSSEEIEQALDENGSGGHSSFSEKLISFQRKPPRGDMIMFVRLSANLLREKLPFDEVLRTDRERRIICESEAGDQRPECRFKVRNGSSAGVHEAPAYVGQVYCVHARNRFSDG